MKEINTKNLDSMLDLSGLIARQMSGELDPADQEKLDNWLKSSPRNALLFQQIADQKNFLQHHAQYQERDTAEAWKELLTELEVRPVKRSYRFLYKYAAAVVMVMAIASYLFLTNPSGKVSSPALISPGTPNAMLILADGENVNLKSRANELLLEKDGTVIQNEGSRLSYSDQSGEKSGEVQLNTLIIPQGGEYQLVLSDGTRIFLNSMSKLVFPVRFSGNTREVTLEGEAFFEVAKDSSKPFIVSVNGLQVKVLGTAFNIKSYPGENQSYTTLVEGKVQLNSGDHFGHSSLLEPNQQAVYHPGSASMEIHTVDASQYVQWTKGRYTFSDQTLEEIMKTLSRWYDCHYKFDQEALKSIRFEGGLNKYESIDPILDIINRTGKVRVSVKGKEILFSAI